MFYASNNSILQSICTVVYPIMWQKDLSSLLSPPTLCTRPHYLLETALSNVRDTERVLTGSRSQSAFRKVLRLEESSFTFSVSSFPISWLLIFRFFLFFSKVFFVENLYLDTSTAL